MIEENKIDQKSICGGKRFKLNQKKLEKVKPLFSIITVVYNGELHLQKTIDSVICQKENLYEYILIDGGSTDNTLEIIKQNEQNIDYWISEPDKGIYDAMNKGIRLSKGRFIGILNSDDIYAKDVLIDVQNIISKKDDKNMVVCGGINKIDVDGKFLYKLNKNTNLDFFQKHYKSIMPVNHPATFVSKSIYDEYGVFNEALKYSADYEIVLRWYKNNVKFLFTESILTNMRIGGVSFSSSNLLNRTIENHYARKINNIPSSYYISFKWFFSAFFKDILSRIITNLGLKRSLYKKYET